MAKPKKDDKKKKGAVNDEEKAAKRKARMEALKNRPEGQRTNSKQGYRHGGPHYTGTSKAYFNTWPASRREQQAAERDLSMQKRTTHLRTG